jgi:hypothetical protein
MPQLKPVRVKLMLPQGLEGGSKKGDHHMGIMFRHLTAHEAFSFAALQGLLSCAGPASLGSLVLTTPSIQYDLLGFHSLKLGSPAVILLSYSCSEIIKIRGLGITRPIGPIGSAGTGQIPCLP